MKTGPDFKRGEAVVVRYEENKYRLVTVENPDYKGLDIIPDKKITYRWKRIGYWASYKDVRRATKLEQVLK
jgi:hypothetical protein